MIARKDPAALVRDLDAGTVIVRCPTYGHGWHGRVHHVRKVAIGRHVHFPGPYQVRNLVTRNLSVDWLLPGHEKSYTDQGRRHREGPEHPLAGEHRKPHGHTSSRGFYSEQDRP